MEDEQKASNPVQYWTTNIEAAKDATRRSNEQARDAWRDYLLVEGNEVRATKLVAFPAWWSSVKVMQPAYYSRTPITISEKAFDTMRDPIARLSAVSLERLAQYLMRSTPFDRVMYSTRDTYINTAKATVRVRFDATFNTELSKEYYSVVPGIDENGEKTAQYVGADGSPFEGELKQDDQGFYAENETETLEGECVEQVPVHYCDIVHTPNARHWEEIDWLAFREHMIKEDVAQRFGEDIAEKVKYSELKKEDGEDAEGTKRLPTQYACIWEIWDKRKKKVYWLADNYKEGFLDEKEDPYKLRGFFPCPPFILGTVGPDNLYPTPDHAILKPLIDQISAMARRLRALIRSSKRTGLYDKSIDELSQLEDDSNDAGFIGVRDFQRLVEKGGLETLVQYFPVDKLVQGAQQMAEALQLYENKFYELRGIPDILRGTSDPSETAAAQQLKGKFTSLRFSAEQREFQRLVRDAIELACDLALKQFSQQKLSTIMGYQFMTPEEQQLWPQALALLQDDEHRHIRIELETDSTITMNQNADIEQYNYLAKTVFDGLGAVAQASNQNPLFTKAAIEMMLLAVRKLQQGKQIEEALQPLIDGLSSQQQQQKPDPAILKTQAQIAANREKTMAQIAMQDRKTQAEIIRDDKKAAHDMQMEQFDAQHQQELKSAELELAAFKTQMQKEIEQFKAELTAKIKLIEIEAKQAQGAYEPGRMA